jgi:hypothetical protein
MRTPSRSVATTLVLIAVAACWCSGPAAADLLLGPGQAVQAGGIDIAVSGYSVPSATDWNADGRPDLIVGEGGSGFAGKVRVYLNNGTAAAPLFGGYSYAQTASGDLECPASGCLGVFPRAVQWDADGRKDLVAGQADGRVKLYLNIGTDADPVFDSGTYLRVGSPGSKVDINVGARATSSVVDWDNDGRKDLVVGAYDGRVRVYLNEGTDTAPDFRSVLIVQSGAGDLLVPSSRSSSVIWDLDDDGKKDLLTGNTNGQLLLYSNFGSDAAPLFAGYDAVESDGTPIDLPGTPRSRPSVCDWTGDGLLDVLIGSGDGHVYLYQGVPEPATACMLALGALALLRRKR